MAFRSALALGLAAVAAAHRSCSDDANWHKDGDPSKSCDWVAQFSDARCGYASETTGARDADGRGAMFACPKTCGLSLSSCKKEPYVSEYSWLTDPVEASCAEDNRRCEYQLYARYRYTDAFAGGFDYFPLLDFALKTLAAHDPAKDYDESVAKTIAKYIYDFVPDWSVDSSRAIASVSVALWENVELPQSVYAGTHNRGAVAQFGEPHYPQVSIGQAIRPANS
mmetsp:Transcript_2228/g.6733  ORF Transcript_2228/g.6733 Transcript_2228/m.6733 type:complete len:224 (-) Transcript_2228:11-682(-)